MKTSVILPTYNWPDALKKVLNGLLLQSSLPDEIIIADDGSTDETRQTIVPFLSNSQVHIKHIWQKDKGFRAARIRNKAIKVSRGEYMIFLDGDCIPSRHFIQDHLSLAKQGYFFQGKRIIVSQKASPTFVFKDTTSLTKLLKQLFVGGISNGHHIIRFPFMPAYTTSKLSGVRSCNMGIFKQDLLAVNGFNQAFEGWGREDSEIVVRLYNYGIQRREHPFRAICYHLWHKENSRDAIDTNDRLLENTRASKMYYCHSGIIQNLEKKADKGENSSNE